jgi:chromosome segregation ATPase
MMESGIGRRDIPSRQPGVRRQPANGHIQNQYEDMRQRNQCLRQKLQTLSEQTQKIQSERDSAIDKYQQLWTQMEQMQKQMQKMATTSMGKGQMSWAEQEGLTKKLEALSAQNQSLQARYKEDVQSLKLALEDAEQDRDNLRYKLSESKRENDKLSERLSCLGPNYDTSKREIESVIAQRDKLRKLVDVRDRELRLAQEKLVSVAGSAGKDPQREKSTAEVSELKSELSRLRQERQSVAKERDRLADENGELQAKLERMEARVHNLEMECQRLCDSSPVRGLGRMGAMRGSSEDLLTIRSRAYRGSLPFKKFSPGSADEDSDRSLQDLTSLNHSGDLSFAKKKLSSSTSNLTMSSDGGLERIPVRAAEANARLRPRLVRSDQTLNDLQKDNDTLKSKVAQLDKERVEMEMQMKRLKRELQTAQLEMNKTASQYKEAQNQIEMLGKEKGVAMRDNAVSYQQSIQLESKLKELEAERQIILQQRDIANKEREKFVMESVSHKKKLEQIKGQRQKDAKELVTMKHMKDRAVSEMTELRRQNKELQEKLAGMEEEMGRIRESVSQTSMKLGASSLHESTTSVSSRTRQSQQSSSASAVKRSPSLSQDLKSLMERLKVADSERNLLHKKLFGAEAQEPGHQPSMADVLHKVESLFQERDGLVLEIEALQTSSNKLNEDRIFDLKQRIEDLMMERDTLNAHSKQQKKELSSLSAQLINTEQERDKLSIEINRLGMQCQQLKSTQERLVTEHSKTLERVNELWKQKWPGAYDEQAWEEKHVTLTLGSDGLAGFSVVGGRDQPQLPNPGAFIVTTVTGGGPADGLIKVGDILESVNGQSMANADHREAVRAVKESKGNLTVSVRRRHHAHPLLVGIVSTVNSVPHVDPTVVAKPEEYNFSLLVNSKDNVGFRYNWESLFRVTEVIPGGPAHQILEVGDRILQVNRHSVSLEKPSAVKKLLKPQKGVLQLIVERSGRNMPSGMRNETGQSMMQDEWSEDSLASSSKRSSVALSSNSTPTYIRKTYVPPETLTQRSPSPERESKATGYAAAEKQEHERHSMQPVQKRGSYSSSRDSYSQDLAETGSEDSESKPTKLVSVVTQVRSEQTPSSSRQRPVSDGVMYGNFNERRIEYEEVLLSEQTTESQYSQSESYLSESSYGDYDGLSSSQSIDLTFHSVSTVTHNRLTVDTMAPTQMEPSHERRGYAAEDGEEYFDRLDSKRNAFRTRSNGENANTNNSQHSQEDSPSQLSDTQLSYSEMSCSQENGATSHRKAHKGYKRKHYRGKRKGNSAHGSSSLTKLSSPEETRTLPPRSGMSSSSMGQRGRSWSNLSLSHAPSMSSVMEEPRRSTSTTNVSDMQEQDPLADATYIRANFTYVPRTPKELQIKAGDVFHIHDEAPSERFRSCFWVSRLNSDGTDERMGPIPNSIKAQEYLEAQGESLDIPIYEEVEAYTGMRPVLIFGALADQVVASLLESYPTMFYRCNTELVEGTARIIEARLKREVAEGKIVDFWRTDKGYEVIRLEALNGRENKSKHCVMAGTVQAFQSLKSKAPPVTILIKAMQYDSIMTFSPEQISEEEARRSFNEIGALEEQYGSEFSASLFLIYMDTLLGQIEDIVKKEKRKQSWVSVTRET